MLTTGQLQHLFQQVTKSMCSKIGTLRGNKLDYFTPRSSHTEDAEASAFGATVPTTSGWHGGEVTVHMYIRDTGAVREVQLYAPHNFGGGRSAKKALRRLEQGMSL